MRSFGSAALTLVLTLVLPATVRTARGQNVRAASVAEQYLQSAADQERATLGLPPLRRDPALVLAATLHARKMAAHNGISHQLPGEDDLATRGAAAGARFSLISENVAESPSAVRIHDAWMHSEGHRHNLLDRNVDAVGISVVMRGRQMFAVEDFEKTVRDLTLEQQESAVASTIGVSGIRTETGGLEARRACTGANSSVTRQAGFVMRYTTADLSRIPEPLKFKLAKGGFETALVAACVTDGGNFSMYSIGVLLFR
jgi:uncharacterized protein YkwD